MRRQGIYHCRGGDFASVINADASRAMNDIAQANNYLVAVLEKGQV